MASYFQSPQGINHVPNFVRAKTVAGLRRAMFINNRKHRAFINYFDIQFNGKDGFWYAWFFVEEQLDGMERIMKEEVDDASR